MEPITEKSRSYLEVRFVANRSAALLTVAESTCSDQQIVTGIAILIAGFAKRGSITVYHWQIVTYLAWMSSGTHLITLSFLRVYLREYPKLRIWRLCGMLILFVMLFIAIVPTGGNNWYKLIYLDEQALGGGGSSVPAACFWNRKFWGGWRWEGAFTYILLVSNYAIRAGALFESNEQYFKRCIHHRPLAIVGTALDKAVGNLMRTSNTAWHKASLRQRVRYHTLLMTYCTILAVLDMYVHSAPVRLHSCIFMGILLAHKNYSQFCVSQS